MKNKTKIIILVALVALTICFSLILVKLLTDDSEEGNVVKDTFEEIVEEIKKPSGTKISIDLTKQENKEDMDLLHKYQDYNEDVKGIIRIDDSCLNHPFMKSDYQEDYYLRRDLDKKSNNYGVPFICLESNLSGSSYNNIIYGHNIKTKGDIFADLNEYESVDYYKAHSFVTTITESGVDYWLIFAYFLVDNSDTEDVFEYYDTHFFANEDVFDEYMYEVERRNWLSVPVDTNIEDVYLMLSSCSDELWHSGTNRMVVMAKKVDSREEYVEAVNNAEKVSKPLLPMKLRK